MAKPPDEIELRILTRPKKGMHAAIGKPLQALNRKAGAPQDVRLLVIPVKDPKTGKVVGGLWGNTWGGRLYVDLLALPEKLRGAGLGTRLMQLAEAEAVRRGCTSAWLTTGDHQAPRFYERLGYRKYGTMPVHTGHRFHFMKKRLRRSAK